MRSGIVLILGLCLLGCSKDPVAKPDKSQPTTKKKATEKAGPPTSKASPDRPARTNGGGDPISYQKRDSGRYRESRFLRVHDGFLSADSPKTVPADEATFLRDNDEVIGFVVDEIPRAYSVRMLAYHHVINDQIGKTPLTVTY